MNVQQETERIKALFSGVDENQLQLVEGSIIEAARLRVELNQLNEIVKVTGLFKYNPKCPTIQEELPVSKIITKVRANYLSYISRLSALLGRNVDDEENDMEEFE